MDDEGIKKLEMGHASSRSLDLDHKANAFEGRSKGDQTFQVSQDDMVPFT